VHVIAFAAFVVKTNEALSIQNISQAVFKGMVARRDRAGQFPDFHLDQAAIWQALPVML
jgi:hypothetical protein